ncbi:MAG: respiratory nitrate reductase subunit gamma [Planctomycetes bacterium]|nr:respiratory nitrate reductase subunit gamma [Planctomycetota bacterium]
MGVLPIVTYLSLAVSLLAVVVRFLRIARMPMHLRWELYPVAHEKGKSQYGGSYLEELDWWKKPRPSSMWGELKVMIPEIIFLAGVWEHNKEHWFRTFPFHFGLYLLVGLIGLLLAGGITGLAGGTVSADAGLWGSALYYLTIIFGFSGIVLALIGSLALWVRRKFDPDYQVYTRAGDIFNLYFFIVTLGIALAAHLISDPGFHTLRAFFASLISFDLGNAALAQAGFWSAAEIVLGSLLIAYIPLTHMSHFFTKYFMYHDIRWSDEPNFRGGKIEKKVLGNLAYPVSWSAPHIRGDGKKNWVDVATSGVEEKAE